MVCGTNAFKATGIFFSTIPRVTTGKLVCIAVSPSPGLIIHQVTEQQNVQSQQVKVVGKKISTLKLLFVLLFIPIIYVGFF